MLTVGYHDVDWKKERFTVAITAAAPESNKDQAINSARNSDYYVVTREPLFLDDNYNMHGSPFTVAGMSSSTSSHHNPNLNSWGSTSTGGPLTSSFSDSLAQSRSHYQSGYFIV